MKIITSFIIFFFIISCNSNSKDFKLCKGKLHPYYYPELEYSGGFYAIKEHFYSNYNQVKSLKNTGIVKIRFHINCYGESGDYRLEAYSLDYKNIELDIKITQQLVQLTKNLTEWIPAQDEDGNAINSHKFFAFRIIEGELIDILPK